MAFAVALAFLALAGYYDLKRREVPNWLTVPPFLGVAAFWAWHGEWALVGLFAFLLLVADLLPGPAALVAALVGSATAGWMTKSPEAATVAVAWGAFFALYALHVIAEADTKIFFALFGFFPDPVLIFCILAGWLGVGGALLFRRYGRKAISVVLGHTIAFFGGSPPSRTELETQGFPLVPAIALGFAIYTVLEVLL